MTLNCQINEKWLEFKKWWRKQLTTMINDQKVTNNVIYWLQSGKVMAYAAKVIRNNIISLLDFLFIFAFDWGIFV